jgi:hypothetical protein
MGRAVSTSTTDQASAESGRGALTGARRAADTGYAYVSLLFVAGVLVQVYLAGVGAFAIDALKIANASSFDAHRSWGFVLGGVAVVLLILALAARESRRTMIAALVLAVLVFVAQSALADAGESSKWLGGLHALDGILILLLSTWIAIAAWRRQHSR